MPPRSRHISDEEYQRRIAEQGGGCAICGAPPKTRRLHADHDHHTGEIRGLLCMRCNRALPSWVTHQWLDDAADYLAKHAIRKKYEIDCA